MQNKQIDSKVLQLLAEHLGLEPDDIKLEDSLSEDLHMSLSDITEFFELVKENFSIPEIDTSDNDTVEHVIEQITQASEF
ncbi:MAG: hypothetical protein ACD_52C00102G0009 [uncultured bacterium]|nr:MAG: hypothetical protein ACD_52C00102G0009 [uncultured bacterium]